MNKIDISSILIKGKTLKAFKIDLNDDKVKQLISYTKEQQNHILQLKEVDIDSLRNTIITI